MNIKALAVTSVSLLLAAGCSSNSDADQAAKSAPAKTAPHTLTVQSVNGSGCPATTASAATGPNDVVVDYTAFQVTSGATTGRKNCQINVGVSPGDGSRAAISAADHAGTATLPGSAPSRIKTTYYVTAGTDLGVTQSALSAPSWFVSQPAPATVVTDCGADVALNVNVELAVGGSGATAAAEISAVHVDWQAC